MPRKSSLLLGLTVLAALASRAPAESVLDNAVTGTPKLLSLDVIRFAPGGVLLIGDGRGSQVLAVQTGDTTPRSTLQGSIERIDDKLAGRLGATAKGILLIDLAVNPASGVAYFGVRKQDDKHNLILTVDGTGNVGELVLENVKHVRVALPAGEKGTLAKITDVAWAGDRLLVAGQANEEFACKIFSAPAPLKHDAKASVYSTETYHVSHRKWETKAPMTSLLPYEVGGKKFCVGAFACTPVVKYPLDDLKPGDKIKGVSVIELGSGNRPLNMFSYEKDGKSYVLMNTFRFHHERAPFGPSPYWTVRLERDLLGEDMEVNEKAPNRLNKKAPAAGRMQMVEAYHGVVHMDRLDAERALAVRQDDKGNLTLTALPLP